MNGMWSRAAGVAPQLHRYAALTNGVHTQIVHRHSTTLWQDAMPWVPLVFVALFYLTPILWVLLSSRSRGGAKFGWFILVLLFSWLGFAVFLIVTQFSRNRPDA